MNAVTLRGAKLCALLATTSLSALAASPAQAVIGTAMTPPGFAAKRPTTDSNGVDVITGTFRTSDKAVAIGDPGQGGLAFRRIWTGEGWYHNMVGTISSGPGSSVTVRLGDQVESFSQSVGGYTSEDGTGSTLAAGAQPGTHIYTTADGSVATFTDLADYAYGGDLGQVTSLVRPGGETLVFYYQTQTHCDDPTGECWAEEAMRLMSVTSNSGYQLKFDYFGNSTGGVMRTINMGQWEQLKQVTAINNAVDHCAPGANSCSYSQAWPKVVMNSTVSGANRSDTLQDAIGNVESATLTNGQLTGVKSPADPANDIALSWDANGRVATVSRGGGTWTYSYSDSGAIRTTTVAQPLGGNRIYVSEPAKQRLISSADELGRTTSYTHDAFVRPTRTTAPEGNYTELTYDARGNVTQARAVAKAGSGLADIVTSAAFPATCSTPKTCNRPTSTTDARGFTTDYSYDASHGGLLTVTLPAPTPGAVRPQTRMSYSSLSAYYKTSATSGIVAAPSPIVKLTGTSACQTTASCIGTADEVKTTIAYGSAGVANNLLATGSSSGSGNGGLTATVAQSYDMFGNPLTVDGPLPGADDTMHTRYDAARRPVGTVGPDPDGAGPLKHRAQRLTYNGDGNVTKVESGTVNSQSDADWAAFAPLETAEATFDTLGRKLTERLTSGGTTHALVQYSYDAKGRLECTAQRMNPAAYGSLPASACTLGTQGSFGPDRISKSLFDSADQVTKVQSALGTADQADDVTSSYRLNGQAETVTDAENNRTTYEYDGHDRLKKTRYPVAAKGALASSTTDYEELGYDAGSNVVSRRLRDGKVIGYGYDALSRMTSKDLPNTATFEQDASYGYDLLGRLTATSDTLGHQQSYGYDALGRQLSDASNWYGTVSSQYDVAGRRTRLTWRDGFYVTYEHLVTGEMSAIRENGSFVLASFGYDDLGRRTTLSRGNGTATTYGYDAAPGCLRWRRILADRRTIRR